MKRQKTSSSPYSPAGAPAACCVSLVLIGGGDDSSRFVEPVPRTVFGLAAYNGEAHLAEAIESVLSQTRSDLAVVVVDDASTDATAEICARYAHRDSRVSYARNDRQLGLSRNWQRAFELAGERHPAARYFAWASDHDVWAPRWHERLAAELEAHDEAVLAYPLAVRVDDAGSEYPTRERLFDTAGLVDPHERVRCVAGELSGAGRSRSRCSPTGCFSSGSRSRANSTRCANGCGTGASVPESACRRRASGARPSRKARRPPRTCPGGLRTRLPSGARPPPGSASRSRASRCEPPTGGRASACGATYAGGGVTHSSGWGCGSGRQAPTSSSSAAGSSGRRTSPSASAGSTRRPIPLQRPPGCTSSASRRSTASTGNRPRCARRSGATSGCAR